MVDKTTYNYLKIFVENVRPSVSPETMNVFTTIEGNKMTQTNAVHVLSNEMGTEHRTTYSLLRKSFISMVSHEGYQSNLPAKFVTNDQMCLFWPVNGKQTKSFKCTS